MIVLDMASGINQVGVMALNEISTIFQLYHGG
jgi:hypothetical protein